MYVCIDQWKPKTWATKQSFLFGFCLDSKRGVYISNEARQFDKDTGVIPIWNAHEQKRHV